MNRKDELLEVVNNDISLVPLIEDMVYLENQLDELRKLPMIVVHPTDPTKQKTTPAAKLYKEYLQQYTNIVKIIIRATGLDDTEEDSPLRKWLNGHNKENNMDS